MKTTKLFVTVFLAFAVFLAQAGSVFAAPALQEGNPTATVTDLACGTDGTTVIVTYDDGDLNTPEVVVEVSLETAVTLGLIAPNTECSDAALADGIGVLIDPALAIPVEEESKHPVGAALAAFFGDITDYDAIMEAHESGVGFGVIAQALWMTMKLDGDSDVFKAIIDAKKSGGTFTFGDETYPNWGQFKKAVLTGEKKQNLGAIMSGKNKDNDGNGNVVEKSNNGKGNKKNK
jgi:hypothetical protein